MKPLQHKTILFGTLMILLGTSIMSATASNIGVEKPLSSKNPSDIQTVYSQDKGTEALKDKTPFSVYDSIMVDENGRNIDLKNTPHVTSEYGEKNSS